MCVSHLPLATSRAPSASSSTGLVIRAETQKLTSNPIKSAAAATAPAIFRIWRVNITSSFRELPTKKMPRSSLLRLLLQLLDEGSEPFCLLSFCLLRHQGRRNKGRLEIGIDESPHPGGQNQ